MMYKRDELCYVKRLKPTTIKDVLCSHPLTLYSSLSFIGLSYDAIREMLTFWSCLFLTVQGFNATLTEPIDTPGRRGDQIKEMDLKLHPELKGPLTMLCSDPNTTIVVLSGSDRTVLDDVSHLSCLTFFLLLDKPSK